MSPSLPAQPGRCHLLQVRPDDCRFFNSMVYCIHTIMIFGDYDKNSRYEGDLHTQHKVTNLVSSYVLELITIFTTVCMHVSTQLASQLQLLPPPILRDNHNSSYNHLGLIETWLSHYQFVAQCTALYIWQSQMSNLIVNPANSITSHDLAVFHLALQEDTLADRSWLQQYSVHKQNTPCLCVQQVVTHQVHA